MNHTVYVTHYLIWTNYTCKICLPLVYWKVTWSKSSPNCTFVQTVPQFLCLDPIHNTSTVVICMIKRKIIMLWHKLFLPPLHCKQVCILYVHDYPDISFLYLVLLINEGRTFAPVKSKSNDIVTYYKYWNMCFQ